MTEKSLDFVKKAAILASCRLESFLNERKSIRSHGKLTRFVLQFQNLPVEYFSEYIEEDMENASCERRRYCHLMQMVPEKYRPAAETLLDMSLMYSVFPDSREALREAGISVSISDAYRLETGEDCPALAASEMFDILRIIFLPLKKSNEWYGDVNFYADSRLIDYLLGKDTISEELSYTCCLFSCKSELSELLLYKDACKKLADMFLYDNIVMQIRGSSGCGKKFLIKHIAKLCSLNVLFVDFEILSAYKDQDKNRIISMIIREALFYNAAVCWYHLKKELLESKEWNIKSFSDHCIKKFSQYGLKVCCCTDRSIDITSYSLESVCTYDFPKLSQSDRISLWKCFLEKEKNNKIDPMQFAVRYKFSCGQIAEVFKRRKTYVSLSKETEKQIIEKICNSIANPSEKLFHILHSDYKLSDLILPEREKNRIVEICANFEYYQKVYTEWNMQSKMPYGRAISVLLCGPPGTGKTMTAHVIANQLELPLFHADLSQISDKYIGETEKHLDAIFSEAEKSNCVLLLDEADSICGKRSEVTDSKDRYANNDTAFLLQRLEQYEGIVILATNYINNLDTAFMRRMKYIIQFSYPDAATRKKIWRSCFPKQLPVDSDIDIDYLAEQFEFAGSNIKNVVLSASFLAASEGKPVNMCHILHSIGNEYLKFQKNILPGEFGIYSEMYTKSMIL